MLRAQVISVFPSGGGRGTSREREIERKKKEEKR